ncbi:preprotein translocase subunit SecG [Pseudoalteromonas tunicata]|jgi:preprotein translocase subunit SecG|uniref:Protein-export membrane protein SecG n=1 Tax=Pseudoalteromonas tunicata D2 TaxID=87626 RepID=A4CD80_9GAMM|nr:preprotein translocase subunit SecG [Pseudoalteromonas tunicata]ATC94029.1 preprotein translocase subunit SecG [Pseudoalteromonas tunicata]AXT29812.1 preprotein translocase subunit SecG [Pseudoalteromonas tunicata]EAR27523.1 protein-export membrane protein secG (General Secretory Pathway) [Pseudoalteromonas tunicata D2]MDP4984017.1 preprotein translocase subunit SecG [Pseudoalteromonas tunicata]MDP5213762.1 preprotein translocase subunit SecG [Pseudoalteromonas tunicata]
MYEILLIVYLIVALALIGMVLIQQGKGADMGSSFGAGASATVFGSSGAGNFMTKTTTTLAAVFFVLSIVLGNLTAGQIKKTDEWTDLSTAPSAEVVEKIIPAAEDVPVSENKKSDVPN